ncbi:DMT family transporter [Microvirga guangxiensis]|uniref:Threonine/homoserine efflux transporter RhtA n=1 Tax=Microvirga guangxiensis TaxID=549386 RepID=A0A1G5KRL2_9HYPH|nr:DMT family transporter [Microvirga guangxiensis]SCZ02831.1 Threonine/homoserine efflux transporter RhtA [Microvirga guangxiensis]
MSSASTPAKPETGFATAFTALCLGAVAMGISPIFVRFASASMDGAPADVGPFASAFWRVSLCLPLLYAWMRMEERKAPAGSPRVSFSKATILAGLVFTGDLLVWHLAILKTTVANATFFATMAPLVVVLVVWLVLRQKVSRGTFIGLGLCLLGGAALIGQSMQADPARLAGDLYGLATAFFFGLYFITASKARQTAGAARVTFEASLITAALLLAVTLIFESRVMPQTWQGAASLFAMSYVSHAGGQGLLSIALGSLPAVFSSLVIFLEAVAAAVFGWVILGEPLTLIQSMGGALILLGIWVARPEA